MRKKSTLFLVVVMLVGAFGVMPAFAEVKQSTSGFSYVEPNGDQIMVSVADPNLLIQVDGLYFRDLNKNGALDVYEDWRQPVEARVADLMSQMTMEEKVGQIIHSATAGKNGVHTNNVFNDAVLYGTENSVVSPGDGAVYQPMNFSINEFHVTTYLSNISGHLKDQFDFINAIQTIGEGHRLGFPIILASDRTYSTWSGMIDMARYGFGTAGDPELLYQMVNNYTKEMNAIGNLVILHTFGHEIGYVYGDDPNVLAEMAAAETRAAVDAGIITHTKHFIGRGGRASFDAARSTADLWESWMVGWKAVVDAGTQWIMVNNNRGLNPEVASYMDPGTFGYLRNELGYNGVVTLDWPWTVETARTQSPGLHDNGRYAADMTDAEIYNWILHCGVDQFSAIGVDYLDSEKPYGGRAIYPEVIYEGIESGVIDFKLVERSAARVLTAMFNVGLFDNPYRDWEAAKELVSGQPGLADELFLATNIEEIQKIRRPEMNELEERLMVESAILLTNDGILPLAQGAKVYFDSNNTEILRRGIAEFDSRTKLVDDMRDADVIVLQFDALNKAAEELHEEAIASGKPIVLIIEITHANTTEPTFYHVDNSNAILLQSYRVTPGYGNMGFYYHPFTKASVTADMLYGQSNPGGKTVFEIGWTHADRMLSFGDLQYDIGVTDPVRLYMAQLAKTNPKVEMPNNLGNEMVTTRYGMSYGKDADIELKWLLVPREIAQVEGVDRQGNPVINNVARNKVQTAGVPFEINFVAENHGYDGHINAEVLLDGEVIATRFVALTEGQFRVVTMEVTVAEAGEYELSVSRSQSAVMRRTFWMLPDWAPFFHTSPRLRL
jgi:beta-glucosidase-like glycosyl hydrolase